MNAPEQPKVILDDPVEEGRLAVLQRFKLQDVHGLGPQDLLVAKSMLGHGELWGRWYTPVAIFASVQKQLRDVDFATRLRTALAKEEVAGSVDLLVAEGVLVLTRLALLLRLAPTGGNGAARNLRLKPHTIAKILYQYWPRITARAIRRKAGGTEAAGLFRFLTDADLHELNADRHLRDEIRRLDTLIARDLWFDAPPRPALQPTTDPSQPPVTHPSNPKPVPYAPLPDDWLAEIGPRVLWVVQDLGPHLLRLLEALPEDLKDIDWSGSSSTIGERVRPRIAAYLARHPWVDRAGRPLVPPFSMTIASGNHGADTLEWPLRTWEHVVTISVILQSAHFFIALLASAGRIGECATLACDCVTGARDGKDYLNGHTYKLSDKLFGDVRQWPAPDILCQSLGQQARLAAAWGWLPKGLGDGMPKIPRFSSTLWVSIGTGSAGEDAEVNFYPALKLLAKRLNVDTTPGGMNVHPHRFRKTIGRLAGIALWHSPLVLKRLFGHKSIEMTLHYILCDEGVREEAEKVLREMRIMHCAEALEEIRHAIANDLPLPGNGGAGAARLAAAVRNTEAELEQGGRTWREGSAYDLACLLTMQGQGWRLIKENIVCSKAPGEDGLCQKKRSRGEPDTANCQPQCDNRIVFARKRRDVELGIEQYLDIARQARDNGHLLVLASVMDNVKDEWVNFADLEQRYLADPEVQALLALCEEPEAGKEAA